MSLICTKCSTDFIPQPNRTRGILQLILGGFFTLTGVPALFVGGGFLAIVFIVVGPALLFWAYQNFRPKMMPCPACGSTAVIPLETPAGRKLLAEAKKNAVA